MELVEIGAVDTTEVCNLSCVMCHFNGPTATRLEGTLTVEEVRKFVNSVPPGPLWFASTGDFLMDPNAMQHLRTAVAHGHTPHVLTNGQLLTPAMMDEMLEIGVEEISISVDAIEPDSYRKIRRGGELSVILEVCEYLRSKKKQYPHFIVSIANVLFRKTLARMDDFIRFWSGKADFIKFQAEYYNTFKMRNLLYDPGERVDCQIRVFLLPNGQMSPCCAITTYQHNRKVEWLPHIRDTSPEEALGYFKKLYADHDSPLGKLCQNCDWWVLFKKNENGESPFTITIPLPEEPELPSHMLELEELAGAFDLSDVITCNAHEVAGADPVSVTTAPTQWAFAARFPLTEEYEYTLEQYRRIIIKVEATVEEGLIGASVANRELTDLVSKEKFAKAADGRTTLEVTLNSPQPGISLVIRNAAPGETVSKAKIHNITAYEARNPRVAEAASEPPAGFVPLDQVAPAHRARKPSAITEDEVWLDVGAHLGEKTFSTAEENPRVRVYAFEPNLRAASKLMGCLPNYVVLPMAVAEHDGSAPFYLNRYEEVSSLLPFDPEGLSQWKGRDDFQPEATLTVPTIRLDTFLNQAGISKVAFLKIDAQGGDLAVIRSAGERLRDIRRIALEVQITPIPLYRNASGKEEVVRTLTDAGFDLVSSEQQSGGQEENLTFVRRGSEPGSAQADEPRSRVVA